MLAAVGRRAVMGGVVDRAIKVIALLTLTLASLVAVFSLRIDDGAPFDAEADSVSSNPGYSDNAIVVRASDAIYLDDIAAFAAMRGYDVTARDESLPALSIAFPASTHIVTAISEFQFVPGVVVAEPQVAVRKADTPSDPLYARQNAYLSKVNAPRAWDIEKGRPEVVVAVLDTGVDVAHPDLQGRIWRNAAEVAGNGLDDDANGCIDDVQGCAFVSDPVSGCDEAHDGAIGDGLGHGTFVAGVIAANGSNEGMVGVARNVTVMPVRVLDCSGGGTSMSVAQGILYAAKNGADVINISLGGKQNADIMREAVRVATDEYGALIVAASGNTGEAGVAYPARYEKVLAVGAASIANADKVAEFSTSGPEVDVVAIGERIVGTVPRSSCATFLPCIGGQAYASGSGTSFSAPQVAGLAALVLSRRPGTPPAVVHELIRSTAVAVPEGNRRDWAGEGRIDMAAALAPQFRLGIPGTTRN
jgi:subtilisin family serine protease